MGDVQFNFEYLYFICTEYASDAFIEKQAKRETKRKIVRLVNNNNTRQTLLNINKDSSNKLGLQAH